MIENWAQVPGFEVYWASNHGRIKRIYTNGKQRILKPYPMRRYDRKIKNNNTYSVVSISKNGKVTKFLWHRIIAMTFMPIQSASTMVVNHLDGDKSNNRLENLEWTTEHENKKHAAKNGLMQRGESRYNSKLKNRDILKIRELAKEISYAEIGRIYGINQGNAWLIANKRIWKHVGENGET